MPLHHKIIGSGEPLVLLHGLFGMLDNWQTLGRRFGESRMAVLVDQRNHGRSPHSETMSYPEMAEDLAAFLADNWMHEVDVLGHSMGGKAAMQFALSYPDRVRKLVVVDMAPRAFGRGHDEVFAAMRSVPLDTELSRSEIDDLLAERIPQPGVRLFLLKNLKRKPGGGYAWKLNLDVIEASYSNILEPVSGPPWRGEALFIRGGDSDYIRDEDWGGITALFPKADLATVVGAGHWVHADQPEALYTLVSEFLDR